MKLKVEKALKESKEAKEFKWHTEDGRVLSLGEIEDVHLFNICRLLMRRKGELKECAEEMEQEEEAPIWMIQDVLAMSYFVKNALRIVKGALRARGIKLPVI